ncbi:PucR family transcriptional regulator [Kitasatospora sp. NPDC059571]|uniref:PucR family transcriptional regulator n=1 Tax=Kitasatospora sp. NPDC059571 TaxID=3346871 RepID=UPI00368DF382
MSHHNGPEPRPTWHIPVIGGTPADQLLLAGVPALVDAVLAALLERVPTYRRLPREQLTGELTRITEGRIRSFAQAVRTGEPVPAAEFDAVRDAAARRAEEGLPLDAVLLAHHLGLQICWDRVAARAQEGDTADLVTLNRLLLDHLRQVTAAAGAGYFEERRTMADERHAARHALLTALLDGGAAEEAATRAGLRLPPGYAVLVLSVGDHPDERAEGVDPAVAGHRKLRRLRSELDHRTRQSALSLLSAAGGPVLVPLEHGPGEIPTAAWERLADLVARTAQAAGVPVLAGAVAATPAGVPAAAELAREILDVARAFGRPAGLHRLDDVLLEYQLTRPGHARRRLAALIEPLQPGGELLTTLRTHLAGGLNRRHTARTLHLHPNTVDYRLRRIAALTGLDPARPADLLRITAAIAAHDAERA